jgi:hypothetical protein
MARWSVEQVLALAPDDSSRKAARGLAKPDPWSEMGSTESLVWGTCQGSGKTPYLVTVDLTEPAFKCSCPSRKFPCKHGVALLLLWAANDGSVGDATTAAAFADDWASSRSDRNAKKTARADQGSEVVDPEAQAKRAAQRDQSMTAGLEAFELWLSDLVRGGLAAARRQPYKFWDDAAGRLVDAQVPGLAERVREGAAIAQQQGDWAGKLLTELGRWFCAARGWTRRDALPDDVRADLLTYLGVVRRRDDVVALGSTRDRWHVVGVRLGGDDRIRSQRTWIESETTNELVLLLEFAATGATLSVSGVVGSVVDASVARYPGNGPRRGVFTGDQTVVGEDMATIAQPTGVRGALDQMGAWLAGNPWLDRTPCALAGRITTAGARAWFVDAESDALPIAADSDVWRLLALTGGATTTVFGELEAGVLHPTTVVVDNRLVGV